MSNISMDWKVDDQSAANGGNGKRNLVEIKNLVKYFPVRGGLLQRIVAWVQAVDNVSFSIKEGETLGMVGESGCGKTTIGRTILRLVPSTSGDVFYDGQSVFKAKARELKALRRNMQIIFQDPFSSLDPPCRWARALPKGCWCTAWATAKSALKW